MAWTPSRLAARLATITHERLSRSLTYRRMLHDCPFFEPIVTADEPTSCLSFMPSLLAWQLDQFGPDRPALTAIFLDTFEAISDRDSRDREREIQRLMYLMPTTLFVVTTRSRLDWAELTYTNELDYVGPARWPNLHRGNLSDEPRQHLVGALSAADCEQYLRSALVNAAGEPVLGARLRARIVAGSDGLPLYLDLAVTQYLEMIASGREITEADFGGSLPSIVVRIMRDLDREQRNILRGVSLLDAFDLDLARAASGSSDATLSRFASSSLVMNTVGLAWPYTLHAQLRRAIAQTDGDLRDAWSPREWTLAARRISEHLGVVCREAIRGRQRAMVAACFGQAVRLAWRFAIFPSWVLDAAQFLADVGMWQILQVRRSPETAEAAMNSVLADALTGGLHGIVLRRTGSLRESIEHFDRALAAADLDRHTRGLLLLHRTHSLRNSGQYAEAMRQYEQMAAESGPFADRARLQLADLWLLRGEFKRALDQLQTLPPEADIEGEALRIRGHVHRFNGDFEAAELIYRRVLEFSHRIDSEALEGKALTNLAETLCWTNPQTAVDAANEAIEFNTRLGNQLEMLKAYVAKGIAADGVDSEEAIREALRLAEVSQYRAGRVFALVGRFYHHVVRTPTSVDATQTVAEIAELVEALGAYRYCYDIARWWLTDFDEVPHGARSTSVHADWLDLPDLAERRWRNVLRRRRAQASGRPA